MPHAALPSPGGALAAAQANGAKARFTNLCLLLAYNTAP